MDKSPERPRRIRKFNPGAFQSDQEVIEQFVVRDRELGVVLDVLRGNAGSPSCQHVLVVAARGRGKTMLLARVAAELRVDAGLSERFLPVRFMEESQEIFDLGDFWLETLFYLAREHGVRDPDLSRELRDVHAALAAEWQGRELEERARAAVLETADRLGRQLVLMVENLQTLCRDVDRDFGWKLRKVLQAEPQIILLATATSRFTELDDAEHAFFELFRMVRLEALDTGECRCLWRAATGAEVGERAIRPLQILTGGDPRLLVIVGEFARHLSLRRLMEDLVELIDDHTEYFRAHLDGLAKTERRVYLASIDLWQPSTTGEIAARARLDVRTVSALLGRLVDRGAIIVEETGRKRFFAAAQRLYSIYYKLRRERDEAAVVRNLIHFMAAFYADDELPEMAGRLTREAAQSPAIREGIDRAIAEAPQIRRIFSQEERQTLAPASKTPSAIYDGAEDGDAPERQVEIAIGLINGGVMKEQSGDAQGAIADYDAVVRRFGHSDTLKLQALVAAALVHKGVAQGRRGKDRAEMAAYDEVVVRFGDNDAPELQVQVAEALVNKGVAQGQRGEDLAEMATYDEVVVRFGGSDAPELQAPVAAALVNKGVVQGQRGEAGLEMATYEQVVLRFGDSDAPQLQLPVAKALAYKGVTQGQFGDVQAAVAICDEVVRRYGESDMPELQVSVALALVGKGVALGQLGEVRTEMATYDEVVVRFGDSDTPELQLQVAKALVHKGIVKGKFGEAQAEVAIYDEVAGRFGDSDRFELRLTAATALVRKAIAQGQLGDARAAAATCDQVVERYRESDAPGLQVQVAMALVSKAVAQGQFGDARGAVATCEEVVGRFGENDMPEFQVSVAMALVTKGIAQGRLRDTRTAMMTYCEVVERFGDSDIPGLGIQVAEAFVCKAETEAGLGCPEDALRSCEEFERRNVVSAGTWKDTLERRARWVRIGALFLLKRRTAAVDLFRSVYAAFVPGKQPMVEEMLAQVPGLIAAGASERDLVVVISSDGEKADMLAPLLAALRQRAGEKVRAPAEVREVATDILRLIETAVERRSNPPGSLASV